MFILVPEHSAWHFQGTYFVLQQAVLYCLQYLLCSLFETCSSDSLIYKLNLFSST